MTDAEVWNQFIQFVNIQERRYTAIWYKLLRGQIRRVADHLKHKGIDDTLAVMSLLITREETEALLRKLYTDVGVKWANIEYGNIEDYTKSWSQPVRLKRFGFNSLWESLLDIFFGLKGGQKIVKITDTTRNWLIDQIHKGREQGIGPEQIAMSMVDNKVVPLARARVISRTEVVGAANFGGITAARQSKLKMNKRWVNARDKRVREKHKDKARGGVGGEVVPLEQPFSNGLMHPGDPDGSAEEVIQCRCLASHRPVRDETGLPVLI